MQTLKLFILTLSLSSSLAHAFDGQLVPSTPQPTTCEVVSEVEDYEPKQLEIYYGPNVPVGDDQFIPLYTDFKKAIIVVIFADDQVRSYQTQIKLSDFPTRCGVNYEVRSSFGSTMQFQYNHDVSLTPACNFKPKPLATLVLEGIDDLPTKKLQLKCN